MDDFVLKTSDLCKSYSNKFAVDHVNLEVKRGQIYAFIGENGAGKTTFMRMVCGLAAPTKGEISLFGSALLAKQRRRLGCIIENPALFPNMTAYENMETQRRFIGSKDKEAILTMLKLVGLSDTGKKKAKNFSLGMKQRLAMAISLLNNPELLILDEPTNGMDPSGIAEIRSILKRLVEEMNITIFISSHILSELYLLATEYGILSKGRLIKQISAEDLSRECSRYIHIKTGEAEKATGVLNKMGIKDYKVLHGGIINIYDMVYEPEIISMELMKGGASLKELIMMKIDLEQYFLGLIHRL